MTSFFASLLDSQDRRAEMYLVITPVLCLIVVLVGIYLLICHFDKFAISDIADSICKILGTGFVGGPAGVALQSRFTPTVITDKGTVNVDSPD